MSFRFVIAREWAGRRSDGRRLGDVQIEGDDLRESAVNVIPHTAAGPVRPLRPGGTGDISRWRKPPVLMTNDPSPGGAAPGMCPRPAAVLSSRALCHAPPLRGSVDLLAYRWLAPPANIPRPSGTKREAFAPDMWCIFCCRSPQGCHPQQKSGDETGFPPKSGLSSDRKTPDVHSQCSECAEPNQHLTTVHHPGMSQRR